MFLHLMEAVDPAVNQRLHNDSQYRPYTLSPLGVGTHSHTFQGFRLLADFAFYCGTGKKTTVGMGQTLPV